MSEMNATPATQAATSETQDFLSSVGESEKRVRVSGRAVSDEVVLSTKDVNVYYGDHHALHEDVVRLYKGVIMALIGLRAAASRPSCVALTMNREIRGCRVEGEINYRGRNVNTKTENTYELRRSIGMVFQQPNPFRKSIRDNITFAPKRHGITDRDELDRMVEESLRGAALWDEVKDKLDKSAYALSGGQKQQRLCIARTLALNPDVILFDEPCSALDPISTLAIEDLMSSIVADRAIVIVTHNMEQASRVSNRTAFFYMGDMVEYDETDEIFQRPKDKRLNDYLTGMFS